MRTPPRSRIVAFALKKLAGRRSASLSNVLNATWLLGLGLVAGEILHPYVEERIFITIFPALAVISVWCGIGPGVLATLFGGIAAVLFWMPLADEQTAWPKVVLNLAVFWLMAGIILAFGHLVRLLLDELRSLEREASLRADEMRHRVQNLFGLIAAIGRASVTTAPSVESFWQTLHGRLESLSAAQSLLTDPDEGGDLEHLLQKVLSGHGLERYRFFGRPCMVRATTDLVLALHELSTNALKYGALSVPDGHVEVDWQISNGTIRLFWTEVDGPPVQPPKRIGFGSRVLQAVHASCSFLPEGLQAELSVLGAVYDKDHQGPSVAERSLSTVSTAEVLVEEVGEGRFVARVGARWLPGFYNSPQAARFALNIPDRVLRTLSEGREDWDNATSLIDMRTLIEAHRDWVSKSK